MSKEILTGVRVRRGATAVASLAATLAANGILAERGETPTVERCTPPAITREHVEFRTRVEKPYARRFELDPRVDDVQGVDPIKKIVDDVEALKASRATGITVEVTGFASDDGDTLGPDGQRDGNFGVEHPTGRNVALAAERARTYQEQQVQPALEAEGHADVPITYGRHTEVVLNDRQLQELTRLSLLHNIPPAELQDRFDGIVEGPVPAGALPFLEDEFGANRRVDVTVSGIRDVVTTECTEVPVPVITPVPVFEAVMGTDFVPAVGPVNVTNYAPVDELAPQYVAPIYSKDKRPREYNFSKNTNARQLGGKPRGRLERSTEGHQGGKHKGRKSH
jgi:hypothetical protein